MQYCDYIALYNARREREQQLIRQYSQHPEYKKIHNLWLHQVDRTVAHRVTIKEIAGAIIGIAIAGIILLLSIWL